MNGYRLAETFTGMRATNMQDSLCSTESSRRRSSYRGIVVLSMASFCCCSQVVAAEPSTNLPSAKPAAIVNGTSISEIELADACLARYGSVVVGALINKVIIGQACERNGVVVTPADVDNEISEMSQRFNVPRDEWI